MQYLLKNMIGFTICIMASNLYAEKLAVVWEKEFGDSENLSYVAHEAVCNNGILQIIGYAFDSRTQSAGKYWFWQINPDGSVMSREDFHTVSNVRPSAIIFGSWQTKGLKIDQNGMYCAGKFGSDKHSFAKFGTSDKKFLQKPIPGDPNKTSGDIGKESTENILRMVNLSGNNFLFVGLDSKSKGFAKKVDSNGNVYWHKTYNMGKISFIADAIEMENNLILLECYTNGGSANNYYEGYNCRLIRCDLEGKLLSEKSFTGGGVFPNKYPELHKVDSNSFLIGYDKYPQANRMGYSVAAFDGNFKPLWEKMVFDKGVKSPAYAHVLPVPSGGFIAAYNEAPTKVIVNKYSGSGGLSASLSLDNYIVIDDFQLVGSDRKLFIIALSEPANAPDLVVKMKVCAITIE
jgi:hypothetical protein